MVPGRSIHRVNDDTVAGKERKDRPPTLATVEAPP